MPTKKKMPVATNLGKSMNRAQATRGTTGPSRRTGFSAAPVGRARKRAKRGVKF